MDPGQNHRPQRVAPDDARSKLRAMSASDRAEHLESRLRTAELDGARLSTRVDHLEEQIGELKELALEARKAQAEMLTEWRSARSGAKVAMALLSLLGAAVGAVTTWVISWVRGG